MVRLRRLFAARRRIVVWRWRRRVFFLGVLDGVCDSAGHGALGGVCCPPSVALLLLLPPPSVDVLCCHCGACQSNRDVSHRDHVAASQKGISCPTVTRRCGRSWIVSRRCWRDCPAGSAHTSARMGLTRMRWERCRMMFPSMRSYSTSAARTGWIGRHTVLRYSSQRFWIQGPVRPN